ncbi:radical SAM protein [Candidatus Magnetomorum sp. HK-1]|nr:radical SAM protein [Candidatus Magnetomorum sp. HK-1]
MQPCTRRNFLSNSVVGLVGISSAPILSWAGINDLSSKGPADIRGHIFKNDAPKSLWKWSCEGHIYQKLTNKKVVCGICPNRCVLSSGDRSICRSKVNIDGKLYSLAYGNPCAVHVDPIEKKPLYHFMPRSLAYSIATTGCNFRCLNCQNWEISQVSPHEVRQYDLFPDDVVKKCVDNLCQSIAYTYSEATTYYEYMFDTAKRARKKGIFNLWISNGYINSDPLKKLCKYLDAANVNLKSFDDAIYRKLNGGQLKPVLNTFKTLHEQKIHFEITHLVVPGYVDKPDLFKTMCQWIIENLGPDYPLHVNRFFPKYKLTRLPSTPISTLTKFREIALKSGIRYVYVGNVINHEGNHTYCHQCKKIIVERKGYYISKYHIKKNHCTFCGTRIPGVWS